MAYIQLNLLEVLVLFVFIATVLIYASWAVWSMFKAPPSSHSDKYDEFM